MNARRTYHSTACDYGLYVIGFWFIAAILVAFQQYSIKLFCAPAAITLFLGLGSSTLTIDPKQRRLRLVRFYFPFPLYQKEKSGTIAINQIEFLVNNLNSSSALRLHFYDGVRWSMPQFRHQKKADLQAILEELTGCQIPIKITVVESAV